MMTDIIRIMGRQKIDGSNYQDLLQYIRLKITEKYEFPPEIIKVDGVTIATLGNFSASTGKPKSKKTFNISAIVASALSGKEVLRYTVTLPPNKRKILYIDTEQSRCHCHKVLERILRLAGLSTEEEHENIEFFVLREYSPDQRRDIIDCTLQVEKNIGLVVIDGIRDLMRDINSPSESLDIINDLMRWSSHYQLHIHTVLHLNKGDDNTRGHIGTELNNKAETILLISKSNSDPNISEVKAMHIRDKEFAPFAFEVSENALPQLVQDYSYKMSKRDKNIPFTKLSDEQHRKALTAAFSDANNTPCSYKLLIEKLKSGYDSIGYTRGRNTLVNLCKYLVEQEALIKSENGYIYNPVFTFTDE